MAKFDSYQQVTDRIVAALEAGTQPWRQDWVAGGIQMPHRVTGQPYRGINVVLLWMAADEKKLTGRTWMTFKQAKELGGMVRKGEKGTPIVFFKQLDVTKENTATGEDETHRIPMLRTYTVFNTDQIDDLPAEYRSAPVQLVAGKERDEAAEAALRSCGADIVEGGARAFYHPATDQVTMPDFDRFETTSGYLATLAHELCHWTGHKSRLDRFGANTKTNYAKEELVAELGAAFIGSRLGIVGEHIDNHAAYLQHWVAALKEDKRAIFRAAAAAQAAADMVLADAGETAATRPADAAPASVPAERTTQARGQLALAF